MAEGSKSSQSPSAGVQPSPCCTERSGRGWLIRKISLLRTAKICPLTLTLLVVGSMTAGTLQAHPDLAEQPDPGLQAGLEQVLSELGLEEQASEGALAVGAHGYLQTSPEYQLKRLLAGREADLARNLTERLMAHALGRQLEGYDEIVIDQLMKRIAADDYRVRTIIQEVTTSYLFTHRRIEG